MKKILALVLCVLTVLSVLASCSAAPAKNYSPKITVSSSAADEFAVWLTNRLGDSLKDNVYLSLGGDAANGLDMTNFENDGYILRSDGDKNIVIAGRPPTVSTRLYASTQTPSISASPPFSISPITRATASKSSLLRATTFPSTR